MDAVAESNRAFRDLEDTFPHIIRALEHGLLEAAEHFDVKSLPFDGAAFSMLVRLHARTYLKGHRLNAENLETPDLKMESVNLCGLWLKVGRYHLKIWKIAARDLAKALEREASGGQLPLVDDEGIPIVVDLAMFWTTDEAHQLDQLYLVQPKHYDDPRGYEWIWSRPISQSVAAVQPVDAGDVPIEDNVIAIESVKSNE
jgi:hypothetical protein